LLFGCFFFVLTNTFRFKSSMGVTFVRVLRLSFEFRSTWLRGSSCDTTPPCCSLSVSVLVDSTSGGVVPPRSECGLHALRVSLARVGNAPLLRPSGWCFRDGWLIGCGKGGPGAARGLTHAGLGGSSFRLSVLFLCFFLYILAFFHSLLL
jgi:hypothetical protein